MTQPIYDMDGTYFQAEPTAAEEAAYLAEQVRLASLSDEDFMAEFVPDEARQARERLERFIANDYVMLDVQAELATEGLMLATEFEAGWYKRVSQLDNAQWVTDLPVTKY